MQGQKLSRLQLDSHCLTLLAWWQGGISDERVVAQSLIVLFFINLKI